MHSPFEHDGVARQLLETLRWPEGPQCPRCEAREPDVFLIAGEKRSHRDGLYQCKRCRRGFSVTVGTPLHRLRVPLSTWLRAAREFSADDTNRPDNARRGDNLVPLDELAPKVGVSYRTVLRMRDILKSAASKYRGHRNGFGAWPRSLMKHKVSKPEGTIRSSGELAKFLPTSRKTKGILDRTEQVLRLLLAARPKAGPRKRRALPAISRGDRRLRP
ncbi:transposase [Bradyrhizobium yuanmingense]|uniref:transposase n=1 Tax=Bradyrhizobium yuanmingense TaxID=108015 RepID=UPI0034DF7DDA